MERDPITNPMAGDVVEVIWAHPAVSGKPPVITCEAVCGNLIAISSSNKREPDWIRREDWCQTDAWAIGYRVLFASQPKGGAL